MRACAGFAARTTTDGQTRLPTYNEKHKKLSELNSSLIKKICEKIGIKTKIIFSSKLNGITGKKDSRLVSICKNLEISNYLSPQGSSDYIEINSPGGAFTENNINLFYHFYEHPIYKQLNNKFVPYLSIIDLLINVGFDDSLNIIKYGRKENVSFLDFRKNYLKN